MGAQLQGRVGSAHGRRRKGRLMSEINVTPFVDVMLVLLVVFMITAPLLTAGVRIDLPDARAKALAQHDATPVEITIDAEGKLYFSNNEISEKDLLENLRHIALDSPDQQVYLRADQALGYGRAVEVMVAINQAGLSRIALISKSQ
ncbi:MAG: protein TolR [Micavibrio sp.]|jgi:biopolymer transport protein TolR|nr:MAG: protein TolR [Micavibrio sp.]